MTVGDYEDKNLEEETLETIQDTKTTSKASKLEPPKIHIPKFKVPSPVTKEDDDQISLDLSDMEDTLKELSTMGDALQEMSETKDVPKKPKIVPEVVEEDISLTEIPQMKTSELKELPKLAHKSSETENGLTLSEIPKMSALKKTEKIQPEKNNRIISEVIEESPNKTMLTEIPKMDSNSIEKSKDLQIEVKDSNGNKSEEFIAIPSQKESNKSQDPKRKVIVPNVIEESTNPNTNSLEGSLFIPGTPKTEVKGIKLPNSQEEHSNEEDDAIFMLKKPSVKLEEIKTESIKTTRSDLFDVFSSIPDNEPEDNEIETEALTEINKTEETEDKGKKSKKKKKKKRNQKKMRKYQSKAKIFSFLR